MPRLILISLMLLVAACTEGRLFQADPEMADNEQVQNRGADKDNWWDRLPRPAWGAFEKVEQSEDWFEVYRIDDDIFAIYEPGQFEEVISFLITGQSFALMFDTGLGIGNIRRVVDTEEAKDTRTTAERLLFMKGNKDKGEPLNPDEEMQRLRQEGVVKNTTPQNIPSE